MTLIAHLTDSHLDLSDERAGRLHRAAMHARALRCDVLAVTGDLTKDGTDEQLCQLDDVLSAAGWQRDRLYVVPGNHDRVRRAESWGHTIDRLGLAFLPHPCVARLRDCAVATVDTRVRSRALGFRALGKVGRPVLAWLDQLALEAYPHPLVVAMHHPPHETPLGLFDSLLDRREVLQLLRDRPNLYLLCGHDHRCLDLAGGQALVAPAVVDSDDPLRVYRVERVERDAGGGGSGGYGLRSVKACSAGRYFRPEL